MAHSFEFVARLTRLRAPVFAALFLVFAGCDATEPLDPESSAPADPAGVAAPVPVSLASVSFAGGIPIGHSAQAVSAYGSYYNGAKLTISPGELVSYLSAIKSRGGKVVLMLAGTDKYYKDSRGFNFTKWKARIDRFKDVNFSSYIKDGTIIGHFLVDEPNDPKNWNGYTISPAKVDEMARYSKQRWGSMATLVRTEPSYFKNYNSNYLDAAWAQYVTRKGNISDYIKRNVADAQRAGLALVVGLNISKGGPDRRRLTASEVKTYGSGLLASSYPCAFISWEYGSYVSPTYMSSSMKDAMKTLRSKAQSRSAKTCRA